MGRFLTFFHLICLKIQSKNLYFGKVYKVGKVTEDNISMGRHMVVQVLVVYDEQKVLYLIIT